MKKLIKKLYKTLLLKLLFILITLSTYAKILIFTHSYNRPDFIEFQYKTFKKFLVDEYEFIVFNDARDQAMERQIDDMCSKYKIECIRMPQELHKNNQSSVRAAAVIQYSLEIMGFNHNDILFIIDSDMFLTKKFCIRDYLKGYDLAGWRLTSGPISYLWNGFLLLDMRTLPNKETINVSCGNIEGHNVDTGGYLAYYMRNNPGISIRYVSIPALGMYDYLCDDCKKMGWIIEPFLFKPCQHNRYFLKKLSYFDDAAIKFIQSHQYASQFFIDGTFYHYRSGTNWNNISNNVHQQRTKALQEFMAAILGD